MFILWNLSIFLFKFILQSFGNNELFFIMLNNLLFFLLFLLLKTLHSSVLTVQSNVQLGKLRILLGSFTLQFLLFLVFRSHFYNLFDVNLINYINKFK